MSDRTRPAMRDVLAGLCVVAAVAGLATPANAADPRADLFQKFQTAVKGKTVAWVPVWLGVLESEWTRVMKAHFDDYGIKLVTRDPNFKSDVQLQAVSSLINDKPDILIVQNPTTTLLARELKRAVNSGNQGDPGEHGLEPIDRCLRWRGRTQARPHVGG